MDLTIACGRTDQETTLCRTAAQEWATHTGHQVRVVATPAEDAVRLARYQDLLAVGATELDVLEIDALWVGRLAEHLTDLKPLIGGAESGFLEPLIRNDTAGGRLVALPWSLDLGLLYYRSDLLARYNLHVPQTWSELQDAALRVQEAQRLFGNAGFWGLIWAGGEDEALTATALEWIASQGGGTLVAPDGAVTANNPKAQFALQRAADWVRGIAPESVIKAGEPDTLDRFRSGQACFMRHWSSVWDALQRAATPVAERIGVAPLPKGDGGGGAASTLGGGQLAVSRYSRHPQESADLMLYLTAEAVQRRRVIEAGLNPTRVGLYADPQLRAARPLLADLVEVLPGLVARPSTAAAAQYSDLSQAFAAAVRAVLSAEQTPDAALAGLQATFDALSQNGTAW